jgi:hypothetical protein
MIISHIPGSPSSSPLAKSASGVAPATPSSGKTHVVISVENARNITILAVAAGFAKFLPRPPKSIFTSIIATKLPNTACQTGIPTGKLNASSIPVMQADKSLIVFRFFNSF